MIPSLSILFVDNVMKYSTGQSLYRAYGNDPLPVCHVNPYDSMVDDGHPIWQNHPTIDHEQIISSNQTMALENTNHL